VLRRLRWRATPQRVAVLRALAAGGHLSTSREVWARAHRGAAGLGLATVYRILQRMHAAGIVERVDVRGASHFGLTARHHDHTICERCGAVEATDSCVLGAMTNVRLGRSGFLVTRHRLDLLGLCRACQQAEAAG
jgi:Fe2+ or Zn2+ uptake regulation protein